MAAKRFYYSDTITDFLNRNTDEIIGKLTLSSQHDINDETAQSWTEEILTLRNTLLPYSGNGSVYFEYNIPRMGRRADVIVVINGIVFVLEYKNGSSKWIQNISGTYNNIQFDRIWLYFSYDLGRCASITLYLNGVNVFYKYAGKDSNGNYKILTLDYDIQYTEILKGSKTFKLLDLPTSRPTIPNVVWNNGGVLSIT